MVEKRNNAVGPHIGATAKQKPAVFYNVKSAENLSAILMCRQLLWSIFGLTHLKMDKIGL